MNSHAVSSPQKTVNYLSQMAIEMTVSGGIGYLMGHAFKLANPLNIGVFCAVSVPVSRLVGTVTDAVFNGQGASNESRFVGQIVNFVLTTVISSAIATAIGFPFTFHASVVTGVALFVGWCLVTITLQAIRSM